MATPAPTLPEVGDTIAGKYRIVRVIAEGGMGIVYEAVHKRLGQRFAIKVLYPHYSSSPEILARFDLEGRIASRLEGLNVARVFDIDALPNGVLFMVMELLAGHDLEAELVTRGTLGVAEVADIVSQAAAGMREAHALGVVHRDLKPANLFLTRVPGSDRHLVKVLDFGISRVMHDSQRRVTADFTTLGTALYMSPEQVRSASEVDARADIWALGIIMYELLTGAPPFEGQVTDVLVQVATAEIAPPRGRRPDIPAEVEAVIMRALERKPADRFQSMDELIDALRPWVPAESVEALALRVPRSAAPTQSSAAPTQFVHLGRPSIALGRGRMTALALGAGAVALLGAVLIVISFVARSRGADDITVGFDDPLPVETPSLAVPVTPAAEVTEEPELADELPADPPAASAGPRRSGAPRTNRRPSGPATRPAANPRRL
ncbi:MAG: protein kinase [Labilithrix sp.]|nr:protein kinase [Labilithrix sp.]MBX3215638.1 protein kinase [Labilithrix sp.]